MDPITIEYRFWTEGGEESLFPLKLDGETLELLNAPPREAPDWAALSFHQCPHCPLDAAAHPHCPLALRLVEALGRFGSLMSFDRIMVEVKTRERTVTQETSAQIGLSAFMGLVIAASGCPLTEVLRPMARFHLPLATPEETVYRVASMYLLAQYFVREKGGDADPGVEGLKRIYRDIGVLNRHVSQRFIAASETDSAANALVRLDMLTFDLSETLDETLGELRHLFAPFINRPLLS